MTVVSRLRIVAPAAVESRLAERLRGSAEDALIYVSAGPGRRPRRDGIAAAAAAFASAAQAGVTRAIVVSSAAVYGASPYTPGFVDETYEAPPTHPNAIAAWWQELERQARASLPAAELTILRPATVVGRDGFISSLLGRRVAVTLAGHDPSVQLLGVDDLVDAIACATERSRGGVFNVAPAGVSPLRAALRTAGVLRLAVPRTWQRPIRAALAPLGLAHSAEHLEFIRYSWTVSGDRIARELEFVPRAAAPAFDRFGQDLAYIQAYGRTLFTFLSRYYWRIETEGLDRVPASGRAVLVGPHRGFMPFDGVMLLHLVARGRGRHIRFLIHPSLLKFPFLFNFMTKLGGILACRENADWILRRDEIAGVFPEGIHGAFTPYRDAYRLGKFGRDEFVRMALRNRAPIVPFATVGSAEIFPILAKIRWPWWERWTDWPYFPITPTFPVAPIPLPSKWHVRFLAPIHVEDQYPPEAADDPAVVRVISRTVRDVIQAEIDDMLRRRRSVFFGSIFDYGAL